MYEIFEDEFENEFDDEFGDEFEDKRFGKERFGKERLWKERFEKSVKHLLIRFSDKLATTPKDGTINEHEKIRKKLGYVWMGKYGRKLGKRHVTVLNSQIKQGIPTMVFLVQTVNREYDVHMARVQNVSLKIAKADLKAVPEYYRNRLSEIGVWFKIDKFKKLSGESLKSILISSSGMPAHTTLKESIAGAFIVRLEKSVSLKDL